MSRSSTNRPSVASVQSVRLPDGRVLCARRWPGNGELPLVVLHGLLDSSEGWSDLFEHFPGGGVAFDLPGFGCSDTPARGSIHGYARDLAHAIEQLGIRRFTLIGHSLGGAVATALAELMPASVASLVLLAPAGFGRIRLAEAISIPGVRNLVQGALPLALSNRVAVATAYRTMITNGAAPEPTLVNRITVDGRHHVIGAREATRAIVAAGAARDAFHRREVRYGGPVFAVWGDRDRLVPPSHRRGVRVAFPHASIELWHGMGHHPLCERTAELVALVREALVAERPRVGTVPRRIADAA